MNGIDYNLKGCLENNPQGFEVEDIEKVLAVWEGEYDGDDWRWILAMKDGRYIFLQGGCDYTGWDCQSWASHNVAETPEKCAEFAITGDLSIADSSPADAGLGHMLNILSGDYNANKQDVYVKLMMQLLDGEKIATWHEKKTEEFGNPLMTNLKELFLFERCQKFHKAWDKGDDEGVSDEFKAILAMSDFTVSKRDTMYFYPAYSVWKKVGASLYLIRLAEDYSRDRTEFGIDALRFYVATDWGDSIVSRLCSLSEVYSVLGLTGKE